MSLEDAMKFYSDIESNKDMLSKLSDLKGKKITEEVFNERILPIAKDMGYDFTYLESVKVYDQSKILNEDELNSVAGGGRSGGGERRSGEGITVSILGHKLFDINWG